MRLRTRFAIVLVAAMLLGPSAATAQDSTPETGEIGNGTARAAALIARVGPAVGNLQLAIRAGLAITQLTNSVAQATGQTLDLGLIGTALTAESCDGGGLVTPNQLPQPTDIDNRGGAAHKAEDETGAPSGSVSIGNKAVSAGIEPVRGAATTTATLIDIPGVLEISAGLATAVTEVLPGEGRQATATVGVSLKLGGIELSGMEWRAFHRTGVDPAAEGSFTLADVAGIPLDIDLGQLSAVEDLLNTVGAPLGVSIEFPRVERVFEPTDIIRVTPLRVSLRDSPLGLALIAPIKTAAQPSIDKTFDAVTSAICQAGAVPLVADIAASVVAGSGSLILEVGGVEASSSPFASDTPFGEIPPMVEPPTIVPSPSPGPTAANAQPPTNRSATTTATSQEIAAPPTVASSSSGPLEAFCASVHPNGSSCSQGAALALGLLGVLVTLSLAGYEIRKQWPNSDGEA